MTRVSARKCQRGGVIEPRRGQERSVKDCDGSRVSMNYVRLPRISNGEEKEIS